MKQILQNLRNGATTIADVPAPGVTRGQLLIHSTASLISAGTERMLLDFGKANWIQKARQQPDKVREVIAKARTDGIAATYEAVRSKLDQPLALGYCNVGRVAAIGDGVSGFAAGDRIASNGKHAEVVSVPQNLCARIPDGVSDEAAAFTVIGAIGLQGIRLADPKLGECVAVIGLGLIGLLTVQMLRAQGCRVLGIDVQPSRLALARRFGAETVDLSAGEDALARAQAFSRGTGLDAVLIAASTKSDDPASLAAGMCRKRGRIVMIGSVGLGLSRADFYEKELTFQVSCSYGPGRYDPAYEEGGQDYPIAFVRWTEQRNFEAVLDLLDSGAIDVEPLISHRFDLEKAEDAFALLTSNEPSLGIVIAYPGAPADDRLERSSVALGRAPPASNASVTFLGAGNYAGRVLIPAFKQAGAQLRTIVSAGGVSAAHFGRKHGFAEASTDGMAALADSVVDSVVIATRHDAHAGQVLSALAAGKHVFCEKPLCLTLAELGEIERAARARPGQLLMVGFNRRFAPLVVKAKALLAASIEPKAFVMTVNAGHIPASHWTQDRAVGGGRIVGEACHFIDLLRHLAAAPVVGWAATPLRAVGAGTGTPDSATITLAFEDGSIGTIHYLANGHKGLAKERLEIFCGGRVFQLDNFRTLRGWGWRSSRLGGGRQDKGQAACAQAFVDAIREGHPCPIPLDELIEVSAISIEAAAAIEG
ncbi:bi-domain-containing oxidoreductase [Rhizorhabdus sp.]|uniref:bi-domain-containing oxidoreductase n=1 Tax=Rhizorhabdus sp. TaxID=1968843 RepID=UPI0019ABC90A|nr:bi-domain-containing oxidoreductase [Rhizorhabdus sp.]MBD3760733.1 bi-domain-containing oxidoreductase [Rhizorhabdus sp.]